MPEIMTVSPESDARPVVSTECGLLRGSIESGCQVFRGIPFAAPPVGELRFRAPRPHPGWQGVREALDFGPAALQLSGNDITESGNNVVHEDCLTLNVWAPGEKGLAKAHPRPVMVWIHGGAFIEGSARNYWYDGSTLATRGDVLVVTIQYRLGALGFLDLRAVGGDDESASGNAGMLDQVAALRWVRDNISSFGGDPRNVTIFGESAGGTAVAMLMVMPAAKGLFHKAIVQSISPQLGRRPAESQAVTAAYMAAAGVKTVAELRSMRAQDMLAAQERLWQSGNANDSFSPTIDGDVLPDHILQRIIDGHAAGMPVMLGSTLDEFRFFTEIEDVGLLRKPAALFDRQLAGVVGEKLASKMADAYGLGGSDADQGRLFVAGDVVFRIPSIRIAEHLSPKQDVWMYHFTYRSTSAVAQFQSAHAMELPFLFGTFADRGAVSFTGRRPGRERLATQLQDAWTSFAQGGVPSSPLLPTWPKYEGERRATMQFDLQSRIVQDPYAEHRQAWAEVPFDATWPKESDIAVLLFADE